MVYFNLCEAGGIPEELFMAYFKWHQAEGTWE
jgi:hypothetical protein